MRLFFYSFGCYLVGGGGGGVVGYLDLSKNRSALSALVVHRVYLGCAFDSLYDNGSPVCVLLIFSEC